MLKYTNVSYICVTLIICSHTSLTFSQIGISMIFFHERHHELHQEDTTLFKFYKYYEYEFSITVLKFLRSIDVQSIFSSRLPFFCLLLTSNNKDLHFYNGIVCLPFADEADTLEVFSRVADFLFSRFLKNFERTCKLKLLLIKTIPLSFILSKTNDRSQKC